MAKKVQRESVKGGDGEQKRAKVCANEDAMPLKRVDVLSMCLALFHSKTRCCASHDNAR